MANALYAIYPRLPPPKKSLLGPTCPSFFLLILSSKLPPSLPLIKTPPFILVVSPLLWFFRSFPQPPKFFCLHFLFLPPNFFFFTKTRSQFAKKLCLPPRKAWFVIFLFNFQPKPSSPNKQTMVIAFLPPLCSVWSPC